MSLYDLPEINIVKYAVNTCSVFITECSGTVLEEYKISDKFTTIILGGKTTHTIVRNIWIFKSTNRHLLSPQTACTNQIV